jgi:hypothetical protein
LEPTQSSPVSRPRAEFLKSIPRSSQVFAIIGIFSLFASIGLISLLMSPVHQTIESAVVTVAIYGGFAVGYAALWIARKFWLIPVWALVQAAACALVANIFRAGVIQGRKELLSGQNQLWTSSLNHFQYVDHALTSTRNISSRFLQARVIPCSHYAGPAAAIEHNTQIVKRLSVVVTALRLRAEKRRILCD